MGSANIPACRGECHPSALITHARLIDDQSGIGGIAFHFPAQCRDGGAQVIEITFVSRSPYAFQQAFMCHDAARPIGQRSLPAGLSQDLPAAPDQLWPLHDPRQNDCYFRNMPWHPRPGRFSDDPRR